MAKTGSDGAGPEPEKRVSLAPLSDDEALRGLLAVKPPPKGAQPKPSKGDKD